MRGHAPAMAAPARASRSAAEIGVAGLAVAADVLERGFQAGTVQRRRGERLVQRGPEAAGVGGKAGVFAQVGEGRVEVIPRVRMACRCGSTSVAAQRLASSFWRSWALCADISCIAACG